MVQQFVIYLYLNKYQVLPSFYLKGGKDEVQTQLNSITISTSWYDGCWWSNCNSFCDNKKSHAML